MNTASLVSYAFECLRPKCLRIARKCITKFDDSKQKLVKKH